MKSEQIKEITARATEQLVAALNAGRSEALTGYLNAIGRFHRYSLYNVMLIASQKPDASYVAGFRTWNQLGRYVKKGEKGILILAGPAPWSPALEWGCANAPIPPAQNHLSRCVAVSRQTVRSKTKLKLARGQHLR
jgi:hypothetical protein